MWSFFSLRSKKITKENRLLEHIKLAILAKYSSENIINDQVAALIQLSEWNLGSLSNSTKKEHSHSGSRGSFLFSGFLMQLLIVKKGEITIRRFNFLSSKMIFIIIIYSSIIACIPILLIRLIQLSYLSSAVILLFYMLLLSGVYIIAFSRKVYLSEDGVLFRSISKSKLFSWNELQEIGIVTLSPIPLSASARYLCFSKEKGKTGRLISTLSKDCIYLQYRPAVIKEIQTYWNEEIIEI